MLFWKWNGILLVSVITLLMPLLLQADDVKTFYDKDDAGWAYDEFVQLKADYLVDWVQLIVFEAERAALTIAHDANQSEMERGAIDLARGAIPINLQVWVNIADTAANAGKLAITYADDLALKKALIDKTIDIQKQKALVLAQLDDMDEAYQHYLDHVDAYNNSDDHASNDKTPVMKCYAW